MSVFCDGVRRSIRFVDSASASPWITPITTAPGSLTLRDVEEDTETTESYDGGAADGAPVWTVEQGPLYRNGSLRFSVFKNGEVVVEDAMALPMEGLPTRGEIIAENRLASSADLALALEDAGIFKTLFGTYYWD